MAQDIFREKQKGGKCRQASAWKPNGEKCPVTNILNGNGVIVWYEEDGAVSHRQTYKAGKIVRD